MVVTNAFRTIYNCHVGKIVKFFFKNILIFNKRGYLLFMTRKSTHENIHNLTHPSTKHFYITLDLTICLD